MDNCVFCKIVGKEIPSQVVSENNDIVAFNDINPSAATHILIVPKKHIGTVMDLGESDASLVYLMIKTAQDLVKKNNLDKIRYRLVFNGGMAQHVDHVHLHLLGGNLTGIPE